MRLSQLGVVIIIQLFFILTIEATSFSCRNALISDQWRKAVLDFHNKNRRKVALGQQRTGAPGKVMPKADDMYYLNWDCDIENNAFLSSCNGQVQIPADYGVNRATIKLNKKCNIKDNTMAILNNWWNQATAEDLSGGAVYKDQTQKEFGVMAFGETKGFACSYSNCGGSSGELLCLYSAKPTAGNDLYSKAQGAVCDACPAATDPCIDSLCTPKLYEPDTKAEPQPKCTTANPPDDGMTYDMQMTAKDMANYYRNLVATGWAQDKNGYTPTAKNMNALEYECNDAGKDAKTEAAKCTAASYTPTPGYALSSYKVTNLDLPREEVLRKAMAHWFGQLKNVDLDKDATYNNDVQTSAKDFANLVYAEATKVGCAVEPCAAQGFQVAICQFDSFPSDGDPLYTVGKACSACPTGTKCNNVLQGLCEQ